MSTSERFLFRGFKILNFSLKVLIIIGSFMRVSTKRQDKLYGGNYLKEEHSQLVILGLFGGIGML